MAGRFAVQARLLRANPGTYEWVLDSIQRERRRCFKLCNSTVELQEDIPTLGEPWLAREFIWSGIDNCAILSPIGSKCFTHLSFLLERYINHLYKNVMVSFVTRHNSLERLFAFNGEDSVHCGFYCCGVFTNELNNPKVISCICSNNASNINSIKHFCFSSVSTFKVNKERILFLCVGNTPIRHTLRTFKLTFCQRRKDGLFSHTCHCTSICPSLSRRFSG